MKIGILTLPIRENYGGILQAMALYKFLNSKNNDVIIIYKKHYTKPCYFKEIIKKILLQIPFHDIKGLKTNQKQMQKLEFHQSFIKNEIPKISKDLYTKDDLKEYVKQEKFDAIIVGSDQVWRLEYINDIFYKSYFLDFVNNKTKKIAYGASFGKEYWEGISDHNEISELLQNFTAVSVREKTGLDICRSTFIYKKAVHVLDPTFLLNKSFYKNKIIKKYCNKDINKGGLLTYILDESVEKKKIIEILQGKTKLKNILHLKGFNITSKVYSIPEWLSSFVNSDFIITDSFHGMVFSIIFEKQFVVIGNKVRGIDRFNSLLSLLKLQDRLIFTINDIDKIKLNVINYTSINYILEKEKEKSIKFLDEALLNTKEF